MQRIAVILTFLAILASGTGLLIRYLQSDQPTKLQKLIKNDLATLENEGRVPKAYNSLSKIVINVYSKQEKLKRPILESIQMPYGSRPTGNFTLQVDAIVNLEPLEEAQLILQFNLFDNISKNKVGEMARLYPLHEEDLVDLLKSGTK